MDLLFVAHIAAVSAWIGVKNAELVVEVLGRAERVRYAAARIHMGINVFFEAPLLAAIALTGVLLFRKAPEVTGQLWLVMILGGIAVLLNVIASNAVVFRALKVVIDDSIDLGRHGRVTRWIYGPSFASVPFVLAALYLGGRHTGMW